MMIDGIPAPGPSIFTKRTLLLETCWNCELWSSWKTKHPDRSRQALELPYNPEMGEEGVAAWRATTPHGRWSSMSSTGKTGILDTMSPKWDLICMIRNLQNFWILESLCTNNYAPCTMLIFASRDDLGPVKIQCSCLKLRQMCRPAADRWGAL